jgi:DnaJ-class molecular chaperone
MPSVRTVRAECNDCEGSGWVSCHACKGRGEQVRTCNLGHDHATPCPVCSTGRFRGELPCRGCRGTGRIEREEVVTP